MEFSNSITKQNQSSQQFCEVDEDLRRIGERDVNNAKELCPFGQNCYRKNPKHFEQFRHESNDKKEVKKQHLIKTDEKKAKITDFFKRKPIDIKTNSKKISFETPNDESDYEIEDSEEDNCDVNKVLNNDLNNSLSETSSKRRKFSPFIKNNSRQKIKSNSNQNKKINRMKNKSVDRIQYFDSDECDEDIKSLLTEDNDSFSNYKKSPKKELRKWSKNKNQTLSPYVKKLEFLSNEESLQKNEMTDKVSNVSIESEESLKVRETNETSPVRGIRPKISSKQLNELIKEIFLFEMPEDFFQLWHFCKSIKHEKPEDAFVEDLGLRMVGPYDILTGKVKKSLIRDSDDILCHWRYFYDLPEFQTIIASVKSGYHLGYFRDTPEEQNPVIVANNSEKSCAFEGIGDNVFAALYSEIQKHKTPDNKSLSQIELKLKEFCTRNKINFNANTKLRSRKIKVIANTFNNFGFIVPVSDTDVGYRPLPITDSNLKKLLSRICKIDVEERNSCKSLKELQEIIQLINYANDECDFGMGLEFGIDLFSFGDEYFHKTILFLMPLAYHLLNRQTFGRIIRAHLKNRRKGFHLNLI